MCQTIVEERRRQKSAAVGKKARNEKDNARRESTGLKMNVGWKKSTGVSQDNAESSGTCFVCIQRGHHQRDCPTGSKGGKGASTTCKVASAPKPAQAQAPLVRATSS